MRELLLARCPAATLAEITAATPLGETGLGLDSMGMVELLVAYEERFGVFPSELLEAKRPLVVGDLVDHVLTCE